MERDQWIPTVCYMCFNCCGIKAHVVDGVVVDIEGNPDYPHNVGKICAKGRAATMTLYDPNRIKTPLKRTNPEKGLGIDPGWKEISWEEAMEIITEKLEKVRQEDTRKLVLAGIDYHLYFFPLIFASTFGTPNLWMGAAAYFCGNGVHPIAYLTSGAFFVEPDYDYCNYLILIGSSLGFMVGTNATPLARKAAEARDRGMRVVVVDPIYTHAAAKADEWIPIRPGTDGAFALALMNVLLNELNIYDKEFLKKYTNGPYLIKPDGYYLREKGSNKPLVWDVGDGKAKAFDCPDIKDPVLEGTYTVYDMEVTPAFSLLKDHVKHYTPEKVSEITTVPAGTIRRIASEFGKAAMVGSKIVIEGKELPLRPACVNWNKGPSQHMNSMLECFAIQLLNVIVGAVDVPGGHLGVCPVGPFWAPKESSEGMLVPADFISYVLNTYPARKVVSPDSATLTELCPVAPYTDPLFEEAVLNPEKYKLPYKPEVMIVFYSNPIMNTSNPERIAQVFKKFSFIATMSYKLDETTDFADIVLPDAHYLERLDPLPNIPGEYVLAGMGSWYWAIRQPVVKPAYQSRPWVEIFLELAERLGLLRDFYIMINAFFNLRAPNKLDLNKKYNWEEMVDIILKGLIGPEGALEKIKEKGFVVSGQKKIEEAYPRPFLKARMPVYLEHFKEAGQEVKKLTEELGIPWDVSGYQPLPFWRPCPAYEEKEDGTDLYAVVYKLPFHTFSGTVDNSWLKELGEYHPSAYKIQINAVTAKRKGIEDGDMIWMESKAGRVKGKAKVTEGIHPEVLGIAGTFGHWAKGLPNAKGKGAHFNTLVYSSTERIDTVSCALDACVKVRVYKA